MWSALPEGRDGTVHEPGILCLELLPPDSASRHPPRRFALEEHVGAPDEVEEELVATRTVEVERQAPLRGVQGKPEKRPLGIGDAAPEGWSPAGRVARRGLDLDDVRPELTEEHAGEESRLAGEIEDPNAVEVAAHFRSARDASGPPPNRQATGRRAAASSRRVGRVAIELALEKEIHHQSTRIPNDSTGPVQRRPCRYISCFPPRTGRGSGDVENTAISTGNG